MSAVIFQLQAAKRKYGIQGGQTVIACLRKYGTFDWENQTLGNMPKSKEQKPLELQQKIKFLEKRKTNSQENTK